MAMKPQWIVIIGTLADGLTFAGPFETARKAEEWAEDTHFEESATQVAPLRHPHDFYPGVAA